MQVDEELVRKIVHRIVSVTHADRIIMFGSASTGRIGKHSDIDLMILERDLRALVENCFGSDRRSWT